MIFSPSPDPKCPWFGWFLSAGDAEHPEPPSASPALGINAGGIVSCDSWLGSANLVGLIFLFFNDFYCYNFLIFIYIFILTFKNIFLS